MDSTLTNGRLSPSKVITVYENKRRDKFYLEARDVKNVSGKLKLMAAVPMSDSVMKNIAQAYMKTNLVNMGFGGMISEHLLYCANQIGTTVVMWYRPAMKKTLNFSASLKIKGDKAVHVPATLYLVVNKKLYLFALADSTRPDFKTKLYNAPFFNIYIDGNVCLGTAPVGRVRAKTFEREAERFEKAFYMAEQNGGQSEKNCKTPLAKLWAMLIQKQLPFPSKKELIQHKKYKTLGDLVNKLISINIQDEEEDWDEEDFEEWTDEEEDEETEVRVRI